MSKPPALKGHALQAPILVMQLAKFQNLEKGTAQDAAQAWWRTMFLGAGEDDLLRAPPAASRGEAPRLRPVHDGTRPPRQYRRPLR